MPFVPADVASGFWPRAPLRLGAILTPTGRRSFWQRHGLSLALLGLMLASLGGELFTGRALLNQERVQHGLLPLGIMGYFGSSAFASATFENWQSEFLAVLMLVVLSIFLRQKGSPQSKPLAAPNSKTGT